MKKFQFSLEKVLEVKEIEEKIIQRDLMIIHKEILDKENIILELKEKISQERINLSLLNQKGAVSSEIMLYYRFIESLGKKLEYYKNEVNILLLKEDKLKSDLINKSQEKKSLERLKEIKMEEYKKNYSKSQQTIIDEISIQNFRAKQGIQK